MFRHSLRFLVIGAAATAGALTIGMGAAQATPARPTKPRGGKSQPWNFERVRLRTRARRPEPGWVKCLVFWVL